MNRLPQGDRPLLILIFVTGACMLFSHLFVPSYKELQHTLLIPCLSLEEVSALKDVPLILITDMAVSKQLHAQAVFNTGDVYSKEFIPEFLVAWTPDTLTLVQTKDNISSVKMCRFLTQLGIIQIRRLKA